MSAPSFTSAPASGWPPRAEPADAGQMEYYLELGVRHFRTGPAVGILANWYRDEGARACQLLAHASGEPSRAQATRSGQTGPALTDQNRWLAERTPDDQDGGGAGRPTAAARWERGHR